MKTTKNLRNRLSGRKIALLTLAAATLCMLNYLEPQNRNGKGANSDADNDYSRYPGETGVSSAFFPVQNWMLDFPARDLDSEIQHPIMPSGTTDMQIKLMNLRDTPELEMEYGLWMVDNKSWVQKADYLIQKSRTSI